MRQMKPYWPMFRGYFDAVVAGTIAGTAFPVIFLALAILGSSSSSGDIGSAAGIAALTILIPFVLVSLSAIVVGIPITLIFKQLEWESEAAYICAGALTGFVLPSIILVFFENNIFLFFNAVPAGILGAISGGITGRTWWRSYRRGLADQCSPS
ncbi:MAG: hypothetical protein PSY12_10690 [bacterium]|nr:hypothetical protein [bacterium]